MLVVPPGQVVCVTASGQPSRGFESALMQKVMHFLAFFRFCSFFMDFLRNFRGFSVLIFITHVCGEDSFVLSSLSPNLPSSTEELSFISPVICPFLLSSVVYRLTLIPLFAGRLWTFLFLDFFLIGKASA